MTLSKGGCATLLLLVTTLAAAQPATIHPLEPSDTSSPRATLVSFFTACDQLYATLNVPEGTEWDSTAYLPAAERILDCLDLSELPKELRDSAGVESAVFLKEVLDRVDLPPAEQIPGGADLDPALATWRIPGTRLVITRTEDGPKRGEFRFSPETVRRATEFYKVARGLPYQETSWTVSRNFHNLFVVATKRKPQQTVDTASPRGTLSLFLGSVNEIFAKMQMDKRVSRSDPKYATLVQQALSCLDVSELPEYAGEYYASEAAVCIKEILDRAPLPPMEDVPGVESLDSTTGTDKIVQWQVPKTRLILSQVQEGPRRGACLFTPETVRRAAEFYEEVRRQPYRTEGMATSKGLHDWWLSTPANPTVAEFVSRLPTESQRRFFGMATWQWAGLVVAVPLTLLLMYVMLVAGHAGGEWTRTRSTLKYWITWLFLIGAMLVPLAFKHVVSEYLTIRGKPLYGLAFAADLAFLVMLIVVVWGGLSRFTETVVALTRGSTRRGDAQLIRIAGRVLSVVAAVILFLEGGRHLGFPVTTLLASAGIGGLAIALAGQSMLKGLFGTLTIMVDKPFREGERIVVKGHDGFVEEIGLRSTKIRTFLTNHLVSIPNDQMADNEIENIGRREHIRRMTDIHLPLDTPRAKVQQAVELVRSVLENHEGMDPQHPPRAYFDEFNSDSFNIRMLYWIRPAELWKFYECSEKINLAIFRLFEEHGIQFSLPQRHSYWKQDAAQGPLEVNVSLAHGNGDAPRGTTGGTAASPPRTPK